MKSSHHEGKSYGVRKIATGEALLMNILITYYIPSGGVHTLNKQRYAALRARGVECHFLYQWPGKDSRQEAQTIPMIVTDEDARIAELLRTMHFDLVIVNSNYMMLERIRRCGYGGPVIFECQGLGTLEETIGEMLKALPYIHSCSNAVLYPKTEHMRLLFQELYPTVRQFSFHNCLDTEMFGYRKRNAADEKGDRRRVASVRRPIVGWVGRIERNKNWRGFLRMAKAWIDRFPQLTVWMFEDADLYEETEKIAYEQMLRDYAFNDRLVRLHNVPHEKMADMYSEIGDSGGFLCSTSYNEGFGYAMLEAMSCRCPVLASDSDGPRSFVIHDKTGKMYPVNHEEEGIRQGIDYLTKHELREKIRRRASRYVRRHFSPDAYAEQFIAMLRALNLRV
jgi:glycosyltransferase involved in cell wall biosynthesis